MISLGDDQELDYFNFATVHVHDGINGLDLIQTFFIAFLSRDSFVYMEIIKNF